MISSVFAVSGALVFVYAFSCVLLRDVPHKYVDGAPSEETRKVKLHTVLSSCGD